MNPLADKKSRASPAKTPPVRRSPRCMSSATSETVFPAPPRLSGPISNQPSTSSGPLNYEDVYFPDYSPDQDAERPLSPTIFTDGKTPVKISAKHLKDHPLHEPTGTSEVLTFYPTIQEFKNFNQYIKKIEQNGAHLKAGVAKIVAPEGWSSRPSKKDFSDVDSYEITQPARETIEATEKPGAYFKRNVTCRRKMPVREFRTMATSTQYRNPKPDLKGIDIEKYYFENILRGEPIYGADTEGSFYDKGIEEWNMNRLGTILEDTDYEIKGVNTVYLYFGMYKTTFPWHAEDMDLYSINFLHFGAPKYWFAISSEHADRFERFMSQQFSAYQNEFTPQCKAFLRHKTYIVTPELLRAANIPYATMVQRPNEFIITFPRGYHMGFNLGYNLAESTNFATQRWIDYGKDAVLCECNKDSVKIDMSLFISKYRPDEFAAWWGYWYGGGRLCWVPTKKKMTPKKRKSTDKSQIEMRKRARLGALDGSCSEGSEGSDEPEISSFMKSLPEYSIFNCQQKADCDEMMRKFKKETKLLRSDNRVDFYQEREYNQAKRAEWPHCAVCQFFQPTHMCATNTTVPQTSRRLVRSSCFSKTEHTKEESEREPRTDRLLTCSNCNVTVHSLCCSGGYSQDSWKCSRCFNRGDVDIRTTSCHFCELRGGALIPCRIGNDATWAHVICALFNRRTMFDRANAPTKCFAEPPPRQMSKTFQMPMINEEYRDELGTLYENSRWECIVCRRPDEGLTPCVLCIEDHPSTLPTLAHVTCARRVGFVCEIRDFPRGAVMICNNHEHSYLANKSAETFTHVKIGDQVYVDNDPLRSFGDPKRTITRGSIVRVDKKDTVVVDFLDNSCSRDNRAEDVQSCECLHCENGEHQYGARVKVVWDDTKVYDCYYRGKGVMNEYTILQEDGREIRLPRNKFKSKREYSTWLKMTL